MNQLSHVDENGNAKMVDVGSKPETVRTAEAFGKVILSEEAFNAVQGNTVKKGDVLTVAQIAGITGAKKTSELIPLCHNIFISKIDVALKLSEKDNEIEIRSFAKTEGQTGIEMEALTAVSIAALTVYDMCKAMDKSIRIEDIHLVSKTGGKSGDYKRKE